MLTIYKIIFLVFLIILILLIIIPFFICKCSIPFVWGAGRSIKEVVSSSAINLLIGLIASAALAYLTAFISYQNDIKQKEQAYLSDLYQIEMLCKQAVSPETTDQIVYFFTFYRQRQKGFVESKIYKKRVFRKQNDKVCIEKTIDEVEKSISDIQERCAYILHTNRSIRTYQDKYNFCFSQTLSLKRMNKEYKEKNDELIDLFNQIEMLRKRNTEEEDALAVETAKLSKDCNGLKKLFN